MSLKCSVCGWPLTAIGCMHTILDLPGKEWRGNNRVGREIISWKRQQEKESRNQKK